MTSQEALDSVVDAGFVAKLDGNKVIVDLNASKASSGAADISEALANLKGWCDTNGLSGEQSGDNFSISA